MSDGFTDLDIPKGTPVDRDGRILRAWLEERKARLRDDWDELIVITGPERIGKSGVGQHLAAYIDSEYEPEKQCTFSAQAFARAAVSLPKYRALVLDEATSGGNARRSMSGDNVDLMDWLTVGGEYNLFNIVCWPGERFLDKFLKEWRSSYNLKVVRRYKDRVIVVVQRWHDGEVVYAKPKVDFVCSFPKPEGGKWTRYRRCKRDYTQRKGRGEESKALAEEEFYEATRRSIEPIVREVLT